MATFSIYLDKRNPKNKKGEYNLTVRASLDNKTRYLNIGKITEKQYRHIFIKRSMDTFSIQYREDCNEKISKCERIYSDLKPFDYIRFRERFYDKDQEVPHTLFLKDLFTRYKVNKDLKPRTKVHIKNSRNVWCKFKENLIVWDITPEFLEQFEKLKLKNGTSLSTINSYHRDLRAVLNYFYYRDKLIPKSYDIPYGKGGHTIKSCNPKKNVLTDEEILSVLSFEDFENDKQRYARNVWAFLYYCNGINFVDLLRLRWDNREGNYFKFIRKKTETTRKNHITPIVAPVTEELQDLLDEIGDLSSPFILGKLQEGYSDNTFENKCHKITQEINRNLSILKKRLNLSVELKLKTARETYATSLKRAGIPDSKIAEMLNHANTLTLTHYLASMNMEETKEVNSVLIKKKCQEFSKDNEVKFEKEWDIYLN